MITDVQYMQIVNEIYDLSDYETKKKVLFCNEAKKVSNIEGIVGKLYEHIKSNCDAIDFGTIPKSKGIITRVENWPQLLDCIATIKELVLAYNEDPKLVDTISTAIDNIQKRERIFTKAFALNIGFPIMMYNVTVTSIVSGVSLLITSSIEYIKNGHDSFMMSFDKSAYVKSKDHVLFQYVEEFNRECASGQLDKMMDACVKNNLTESADLEAVNEDAFTIGKIIGLAVTGIGLIIFGFKILRVFIYWLLRMKMKISDWFYAQAVFLQVNAENLKYRTDDKGDDHKKVVYQRQMKWVETFNKIANSLALKDSKAQKEAKQDEDEYMRKRRYEDDDNGSSDDSDDGGLF